MRADPSPPWGRVYCRLARFQSRTACTSFRPENASGDAPTQGFGVLYFQCTGQRRLPWLYRRPRYSSMSVAKPHERAHAGARCGHWIARSIVVRRTAERAKWPNMNPTELNATRSHVSMNCSRAPVNSVGTNHAINPIAPNDEANTHNATATMTRSLIIRSRHRPAICSFVVDARQCPQPPNQRQDLLGQFLPPSFRKPRREAGGCPLSPLRKVQQPGQIAPE